MMARRGNTGGRVSGANGSNTDLKRLRRMDLLEILLDQMNENESQADEIAQLTDLSSRLKAKLDEKDAQIEHLKDRLNQKDAQIKYMQQHGVPALGAGAGGTQPTVVSAVQATRAIPSASGQAEGAPSLTASYVVSATYPAMGAVGGQVVTQYAQQAAAPAVSARPVPPAVAGAVPGQRVLASPDPRHAQRQQQLVRQQLAQKQAAQQRMAAQQMAQQRQPQQQQPQPAQQTNRAQQPQQPQPVQPARQAKPQQAQPAQQPQSAQQPQPAQQTKQTQSAQPARQMQPMRTAQHAQSAQPAQQVKQAQSAQPAQQMRSAQPAAVLNEFAPPAFPDSITQLMASINASAAQPTANGGGA